MNDYRVVFRNINRHIMVRAHSITFEGNAHGNTYRLLDSLGDIVAIFPAEVVEGVVLEDNIVAGNEG